MDDAGVGLAALVAWFEGAEDASQTARAEAERDRDYLDGKQLTSAERDALRKRGQPPLVFNLIRPRIELLCGLEIERRTDPKAYPRTPQHEQDSEAVTDALRYAADISEFPSIASAAWENLLVEGACGAVVDVDPETQDIRVTHVPWDRLFWDPHSRRPDFSDAKFKGVVIWMDYEDAKDQYPDGHDIISRTFSEADSNTYADRPAWQIWADVKRTRIRICEIHYRTRNGWRIAHFTRGGVLLDVPSPFRDAKGYAVCPLIMQSGHIDRENNRYGEIRDMRDPQDEVNKRHSKALHLLNARNMRVGRSLAGDKDKIRAEAAKPDGVIVADADEFEVIATGDMAVGQINLLQEAKALLSGVGPSDAAVGNAPSSASGRAIIASQQANVAQRAPMLERIRQFKLACYRAMWDRIRQFWTGERWVRVTDDERNVRFVPLNRVEVDPMTGMPVIRNAVAQIDVDIVIEESPDYVTIQSEQFEQLTQALPVLAQVPPALAELYIRASQLRNKDALVELLRGGGEQQPPPDPMAEQAAMLQLAKAEADVRAVNARAAKDEAAAITAGQPVDQSAQPFEAAERLAKVRLTEAQAEKLRVETARAAFSPVM